MSTAPRIKTLENIAVKMKTNGALPLLELPLWYPVTIVKLLQQISGTWAPIQYKGIILPV